MFLVQISDTHIDEPGTLVYGHFDTAVALEKAVDAINAMKPGPDLVLHAGDIVLQWQLASIQGLRGHCRSIDGAYGSNSWQSRRSRCLARGIRRYKLAARYR